MRAEELQALPTYQSFFFKRKEMKNKDWESRNTSGRNNFGYAVMHVRERLLCFAGYHLDGCECENGMMFERFVDNKSISAYPSIHNCFLLAWKRCLVHGYLAFVCYATISYDDASRYRWFSVYPYCEKSLGFMWRFFPRAFGCNGEVMNLAISWK